MFVSYGRKDASEFVDRLVEDLTHAGFHVWHDTAQLRSPRPWDEQIQEALKRADAVIAVLTPHAVRVGREAGSDGAESVCLDELAFARFSPPPTPIVPILLIQCEPPFVVYRLQYLDFLGASADETRYQRAFNQLVGTLKAINAGASPTHRATAFEPLDFDLYLKAKTRDFVGREWLLGELFERLQTDASPAIILVADPGWGKSAFAAHLFGANPDGQLLAAHFCRADRADSIDPRRFIESLVAMTSIRVPAYAAAIASKLNEHQELLRKGQVKEAFECLFLEPLAKLDPATLGKLPRYVLVDSLDEAAGTALPLTIDALLAQTMELLPEWLRIVATSRDKPSVLDAFGTATVMRLAHDDARNQRDMRTIIARLLAPADQRGHGPSPATVPPDLSELIAAKADGNALCAAQLSLAVRRSGMDANAIATLPRGLIALYRAIFQRRFDPTGSEWATLREILQLVVVTRAAFPIALVAFARADAAQYSTRAMIEGISDLLTIHDDKIRLFHQSVIEFLLQPGTPFFVSPSQGAARLLDLLSNEAAIAALAEPLREFCRQNFEDWLRQCDDLKKYAPSLPGIYDKLLFSKPAELSYLVAGVTIDERDERLLARLATAGFAETVVAIIAAALTSATERLRAAGFTPWFSESGRPPPDAALSAKFAREFEASFQIACFALAWAKIFGGLAPEMRPRLHEILQGKDPKALYYIIGWLDIASGCQVLGLPGYFEHHATYVRIDWKEIEAGLA